MRYWVDTCIWRDFYEDRISDNGIDLSSYASDVFTKIILKKDKIIYSEALIWELRKRYTNNEINELLGLLLQNGILIRIPIIEDDKSKARTLSKQRGIPFSDCLIAVQAKRNNAIVISQDKHLIYNLSDTVRAIRPNEIN